MIDERGQIAVDFLLGISLFLIALMFIVQFIPGLFLPGSANEGSLDHTAYRTATILTEDPGWWGDGMSSDTEWEHADHIDKVKRIGLAVDDDSSSKLTNTPNLISKNKTLAMMQLDRKVFEEKLGLYDNVNDALFFYGYNISFSRTLEGYDPVILDNTSITRGSPVPTDRDVTRIVRIVLLETGKAAYFDAEELTTTSSIPSESACINIIGPVSGNVTILLSNFNITGGDPGFRNLTLNGSVLSPSSYSVYKRTEGVYVPLNGHLQKKDTLRLDLNSSLFTVNQTLGLEFKDVSFTVSGEPLLYNAREEILYEPAYLTVEVWQ